MIEQDESNDQNQYHNNINYFHNISNIDDVQNVVNAVNSALSVDLISSQNFENYDNIDPSISNQSKKEILHDLNNVNRDNNGNGDQNIESIEEINGKFEIPSGVDPKKICPFCGKTFSHPGSLGRHLDLKKGTRLHPEVEINSLRANVKRRGDQVEIKTRRKKKSKEYNAREEVKERNRIRRRLKDRQLKAKDISQTNFLSKLGIPSLQPHPTFARLVLYFLPPNQWPHDPPTMETYRQLTNLLNPSPVFAKTQQAESILYSDYMTKLQAAFENWLTLSHSTKQNIWIREQRKTAEDSLGSLSLFDLATRDLWIQDEERRHFDILTRDQNENPNENNSDDEKDRDKSDSQNQDEAQDEQQHRSHRLERSSEQDQEHSEDGSNYYHDNNADDASVAFAAVAAAVAHNNI